MRSARPPPTADDSVIERDGALPSSIRFAAVPAGSEVAWVEDYRAAFKVRTPTRHRLRLSARFSSEMFGIRSKSTRGDAFERGEWKRSRRLLEEALQDEPRPAGFYHLGVLYWRGLGGAVDKSAAVECFERGAEFGHPGAQTAYGIALRSGVGAAKDNAAAQTQFRSAAGAGDREAMVQLATMSEPDDARRG